MFYKFVGKDKLQQFELSRILFLENKVLEEKFQESFNQLSINSMKFAPKDNSDNNSNKSSVIPSAKSETTPKSSGVQISGPIITQTDPEEWRQWVLQHLDEYVLRVSGNEGINLIAGWHGSTGNYILVFISCVNVELRGSVLEDC